MEDTCSGGESIGWLLVRVPQHTALAIGRNIIFFHFLRGAY